MIKRLPLYQIDAFTDTLFRGNPAAVVVLDEWIDNSVMQKIAAENNLSETAFIVPRAGYFDITWFTPTSEIDLCGHATLSAAHVIFHHLNYNGMEILFKTRQVGDLTVKRGGDILYLNFPSRPPEKIDSVPPIVIEGLGGIVPTETYVSRDFMLVFDNSDIIRNIKPDFKKLNAGGKWVLITAPAAPSDKCDFVSRMFCAGDGIEEDPVTGSTHCNLIPYWSNRIGKKTLLSRQLSARGGTLYCELQGERVQIGGHAVTYMEGTISIPL
jgi:predicted PhzF superfamily epimerase YddE/YHI9